jgi:hypothetical protein
MSRVNCMTPYLISGQQLKLHSEQKSSPSRPLKKNSTPSGDKEKVSRCNEKERE